MIPNHMIADHQHPEHGDAPIVFQQDGAPSHTLNLTQSFFEVLGQASMAPLLPRLERHGLQHLVHSGEEGLH